MYSDLHTKPNSQKTCRKKWKQKIITYLQESSVADGPSTTGPEELELSAEEEGLQNSEGRRCPKTMDFTM